MPRRVLSVLLAFVLIFGTIGTFANDHSDIVFFNTQTFKYHCLTCKWAKKCTRHCIKLSRDEAVARGGIACKVCGGRCR